MAKGHNEPTRENDYIDQLEWQANHRRRRSDSVHYEPKWKYQIVYRYPPTTPLGRLIRMLVLACLVGLPVYLIFSSDSVLGAKIFFSVAFAMVVAVIFFAARDVSKNSKDDSENLD